MTTIRSSTETGWPARLSIITTTSRAPPPCQPFPAFVVQVSNGGFRPLASRQLDDDRVAGLPYTEVVRRTAG